MNTTAIEAIAAAWGLAGAFLLAANGRRAALGWPAYLASNVLWILYASRTGAWFLLAQQIGFTVASCLGIWTYVIKPRRP